MAGPVLQIMSSELPTGLCSDHLVSGMAFLQGESPLFPPILKMTRMKLSPEVSRTVCKDRHTWTHICSLLHKVMPIYTERGGQEPGQSWLLGTFVTSDKVSYRAHGRRGQVRCSDLHNSPGGSFLPD
jgi:hypothetical protein